MTSQSGLPPSITGSSRDLARLEALIDSPALSRHPAAVALSQELERAQVLPPEEIPAGIVTMHSRVDCVDELHDEQHSLTLVYPHEADFDKGRVSVLAPVGSALLGLSVGDQFQMPSPTGVVTVRVDSIDFQPESAGELHR